MVDMPIICVKENILWNQCKTLWHSVETVYFLFQFEYEVFCIIYTVFGDIEEDMLQVFLGIERYIDFIFFCHV